MPPGFRPDAPRSAPLSPPDSYWLDAALKRAIPTATITTVAQRHYRLYAVACDTPLLIFPLAGTKRFHCGGKTWECRAGQFLMTHFAVRADVENIPDGGSPYRAWAIPFPWAAVDMARGLIAGHALVPVSSELAGVGEVSSIEEALLAYLRDAAETDPALQNYRLLGILLALFRAGQDQFILANDPSLSSRIRVAVSANPAREWASANFEALFHLSGATLRRRLAAEGASLRGLIQEARLHSALVHLQTMRTPLKAVASAHGYRSVTSFRHNFSERFGLDPAEVANP